MPKTRAVGVKFLRLELASEQMALIRAAAGTRPLQTWALLALRNGLAFRGTLPSAWLNRGQDRESLFIEIAPDLLAEVDARATHVGRKRSDFARACFKLALGG